MVNVNWCITLLKREEFLSKWWMLSTTQDNLLIWTRVAKLTQDNPEIFEWFWTIVKTFALTQGGYAIYIPSLFKIQSIIHEFLYFLNKFEWNFKWLLIFYQSSLYILWIIKTYTNWVIQMMFLYTTT